MENFVLGSSQDRIHKKSISDMSAWSSQVSMNTPSTDDFYDICRSHLKISLKNSILQIKINGLSDYASLSFSNSDLVEELTKKHAGERKQVKAAEELQIGDIDINQKSKTDLSSPLILFIVPEKHLKYLVPDYEKKYCKNSFESTECHESWFGLGRLSALEGNFHKSLEYIQKALLLKNDEFYKLWLAVIKVKIGAEPEPVKLNILQKIWCCGVRKKYMALEELESLGRSIESLWGMLEVSLKGYSEIEKPEYFAAKLKEMNEYYGYLSWAEIYNRRNDYLNFSQLISEIIKKYGCKPEAFAKHWRFAYYTLKDYQLAEEIIQEALLKINPNNYFQYYILFSIYLAKTLFKQKRFAESLSFLQRKFVEHPTYPVFLYQFGRLCVKSEDFRYNGVALSALQESLRLCDDSRTGDIYYWLTKAFILARLYDDAFKTATQATDLLDRRKLKKITELKSFINEIKPSMKKIEKIKTFLEGSFSSQEYETCRKLCKEIQHFHKLLADVLHSKMLWKINRKEKAVKILYSVCGISTVKMTGYFVLLKFLREIGDFKCMKNVASEMIGKCLNPQVPSFIWAKAVIIYAKILAKLKKPGKAILLLKTLAKLLPPFPFANVEYTKALQRSSSIFELKEAHKNYAESYKIYNFGNYKNSFIDTFTDCRDFSKQLIEDEEKQYISKQNQRRKNKFGPLFDRSFGNRKVTFDLSVNEKTCEKLRMPELKIHDFSDIVYFSICSDIKFLLKIAQVSFKNQFGFIDGICAISDYIELLKFEKSKVKARKRQEKALKLYDQLLDLSRNCL